MEREESAALAATILEAAGWKPINSNVMAGGYVAGDLVGGTDPAGESHVKNIAAIPPGHELYSADTPDEHHEAAQWLVDRFAAQREANVLASDVTFEPPPIELVDAASTGVDTHDSKTEEIDPFEEENAEITTDEARIRSVDESEGNHPIDADFSEPEQLPDITELGEELAQEHPEEYGAGGAFIFGDNLHQMRTAAIGMAVQAALRRLPAGIDYAKLSELRNFTMGVSEGRWPDNTAKRDELDGLEATERLRRQIEQVRDEKVAVLLEASREEIEAFDPEAGWP